MIVKRITGECPECEAAISLDFDEVEILDDNGILRISFECPKCNGIVSDEEMEADY